MSYKDFLNSALQEASQIANQSFGKVSGTIKPDDNNQVLTETDIAIGKLLVNKVKEAYPDYNIIDEEAGIIDNKSEYTWVIDPIDGTSNFANGIPTYGIMIGLLKNDVPIAGGIGLPYFDIHVVAEKGKGTFSNEKKVTVSQEKNLFNCLIVYEIDGLQDHPEFTHEEGRIIADLVLNIRNLRTSGSTAFDLAFVAAGNYSGALNRTTKIWDNIAPHIIIEEAGGVYTDFWGKPMDYTNALKRTKENLTFCAASPQLHKQLQDIIHGFNTAL